MTPKRKIAMIVHGGAGPDSEFIRNNIEGYKEGLKQALHEGYKVLEKGGGAVDAVEAAVIVLEDNPLFNAGRGSELNRKGGVGMCSSIMSGKEAKSGAVAIVKNIKNPCTLARAVMEKSSHIYMGGPGAIEFGREVNVEFCNDEYFITPHALETYEQKKKEEEQSRKKPVSSHGTVGAVACDVNGNIAACTSTGGTEFDHEARIVDSSMIGVGTYADNRTCAVSTTGDGEHLIRNVVGFQLNSLVDLKNMNVDDAAQHLIHERLKDVEGDMGLIAVDNNGNITMQFNSERMHRAWKTSDGNEGTEIY
jgi:beta-aspartyl-peptidase (threonine type)